MVLVRAQSNCVICHVHIRPITNVRVYLHLEWCQTYSPDERTQQKGRCFSVSKLNVARPMEFTRDTSLDMFIAHCSLLMNDAI